MFTVTIKAEIKSVSPKRLWTDASASNKGIRIVRKARVTQQNHQTTVSIPGSICYSIAA